VVSIAALTWPIADFDRFVFRAATPTSVDLVLGIVTIVTAGLVVLFYNSLERREATEKTARYPLAAGQRRPLPPAPRLQTYPFDDIKELRRSELPRLERYEWVDKNTGVVRIPIERAIDLIAERGLPHRAPAPAGEKPVAGATESPRTSAGAEAPAPQSTGAHGPAPRSAR
jgi:hypothetical protein